MQPLTGNRAIDGNAIFCIGMDSIGTEGLSQWSQSFQHHPEKGGYNAHENEGTMPKVQPEHICQAPSWSWKVIALCSGIYVALVASSSSPVKQLLGFHSELSMVIWEGYGKKLHPGYITTLAVNVMEKTVTAIEFQLAGKHNEKYYNHACENYGTQQAWVALCKVAENLLADEEKPSDHRQ